MGFPLNRTNSTAKTTLADFNLHYLHQHLADEENAVHTLRETNMKEITKKGFYNLRNGWVRKEI